MCDTLHRSVFSNLWHDIQWETVSNISMKNRSIFRCYKMPLKSLDFGNIFELFLLFKYLWPLTSDSFRTLTTVFFKVCIFNELFCCANQRHASQSKFHISNVGNAWNCFSSNETLSNLHHFSGYQISGHYIETINIIWLDIRRHFKQSKPFCASFRKQIRKKKYIVIHI